MLWTVDWLFRGNKYLNGMKTGLKQLCPTESSLQKVWEQTRETSRPSATTCSSTNCVTEQMPSTFHWHRHSTRQKMQQYRHYHGTRQQCRHYYHRTRQQLDRVQVPSGLQWCQTMSMEVPKRMILQCLCLYDGYHRRSNGLGRDLSSWQTPSSPHLWCWLAWSTSWYINKTVQPLIMPVLKE